jgi:electron transfer flavoprotein beta subunit
MRPIKERERAAKKIEISNIGDFVRELYEKNIIKLEEE